MSMDIGASKGGIKSDINVTPLVDVMLVLLIIMLVVAPLLQAGADVRLPLAANTAEKPETQQTVLAVDKNDRYYVNGLPVRKEELRTKVEAVLENKKERIILIKADADARYAAVMDAMDEMRASGIEDIGLITNPKSRQAALRGGGGN